MSKVAFKIVRVKRPISEEVIGYRMVLAVCNQAQWNHLKGRYEQSFQPTYRITESSDYSRWPTKDDVSQFLGAVMSWFLITDIEDHTK